MSCCTKPHVIFMVFVAIFFAGHSGSFGKQRKSVQNLLKNGGFEQGLTFPWGTGAYSEGRPIWWNKGDCRSTAELDETDKMSGLVSLHIMNPTPLPPDNSTRTDNYGTMAQRVAVKKNHVYQVSLWAKGKGIASSNSFRIVVDTKWVVCPVTLSGKNFSWRKFEGVFVAHEDYADIRILSADQGEAWLDDIQVIPIENYFSPAQ